MRTFVTSAVASAALLLAGCADGGGAPTDPSRRREPLHIGSEADDSGLYDTWDFYGQDAEYDAILVASARDDGTAASITATPRADGSVDVRATVGDETASLELAPDGTLLAMHADGPDVRALIAEAASDLAARADALTWNGEDAASPESATGDDISGSSAALAAQQWVVELQCMFAKVAEYVGAGGPAELTCEVTIDRARRLALRHAATLVFIVHNQTELSYFGGRWNGPAWPGVNVRAVGRPELDVTYVVATPTNGYVNVPGAVELNLYATRQEWPPRGTPAWSAVYHLTRFGRGVRTMDVTMSPDCDSFACLAVGQTCQGTSCVSQFIDGETLPTADGTVMAWLARQ